VRLPEAGLNKPFDRILKAFVGEAPEVFLHLLGVIPPGAKFQITPLRPESAPAVVMPDFVASLVVDSGEPFIFHVEFLLAYHAEIPSTMARYGGSLAWQYRREVMSIVMLLRPQGVPMLVPEVGDYAIGRTHTIHPFRVVRLWEVDPGPLLEVDDWRLLPWSVLMDSSDEDVRRVARILGREGDEESIGRFLTLGSIRYDRNRLEEMLGGSKMGLVEAILEGSSLVREATEKAAREGASRGLSEGLEKGLSQGLEKGLSQGLEKGLAEGREKGLAEGRAEGRIAEAHRLLRVALKAKFPGLESAPEIDAIAAAEKLESLLEIAITSTDRSIVEHALAAAVAQ
jgi:predicted transposase YdaD